MCLLLLQIDLRFAQCFGIMVWHIFSEFGRDYLSELEFVTGYKEIAEDLWTDWFDSYCDFCVLNWDATQIEVKINFWGFLNRKFPFQTADLTRPLPLKSIFKDLFDNSASHSRKFVLHVIMKINFIERRRVDSCGIVFKADYCQDFLMAMVWMEFNR